MKSIVYKTTFPNGKIYVGLIRTHKALWPQYGGSGHPDYIAADFTAEQLADFTVRKQYLWQSDTATKQEVLAIEIEFIRALRANDPAVDYNQTPRLPGITYPFWNKPVQRQPAPC
jgi:hypothetical protein